MSENSNRSEASIRELMIRRRMQGGLPHHLAIVMDGNRRYAKSLGYPTALSPSPSPFHIDACTYALGTSTHRTLFLVKRSIPDILRHMGCGLGGAG